ncbi:MAG TPA: Holliday junction resolvase RuvX [Propionibacteriaceae bacterium]|nr:Holliday junction resolvase RuvX [Propionibacteriaceae bacterium]
MRPGVRMAVDWGEVRIGVAACDRDAVLAYPLRTVRTGEAAIAELAALAAEHQVIEIVVGLPRSLSGTEGPAARKVREQAARLAAATPIPVRLLDERLSTVTAAARLRDSGKSARRQRTSIDAAAAVVILEEALDYERSRQQPPGELVSAGPG